MSTAVRQQPACAFLSQVVPAQVDPSQLLRVPFHSLLPVLRRDAVRHRLVRDAGGRFPLSCSSGRRTGGTETWRTAGRLRDAPVGHFFDVISNGYGRMYSYATRVAPEDRWAIIAYIRALQLSQNATVADVPPEQRTQIQGAVR